MTEWTHRMLLVTGLAMVCLAAVPTALRAGYCYECENYHCTTVANGYFSCVAATVCGGGGCGSMCSATGIGCTGGCVETPEQPCTEPDQRSMLHTILNGEPLWAFTGLPPTSELGPDGSGTCLTKSREQPRPSKNENSLDKRPNKDS